MYNFELIKGRIAMPEGKRRWRDETNDPVHGGYRVQVVVDGKIRDILQEVYACTGMRFYDTLRKFFNECLEKWAWDYVKYGRKEMVLRLKELGMVDRDTPEDKVVQSAMYQAIIRMNANERDKFLQRG